MQAHNEELVVCHLFGDPLRIRGEVAECNMYEDRSQPTLHAMREIAWRVSSDKTRPIGFLSPAEYRRRVKESGGEDDEGPIVTPGGDVWH